MRSKNPAHAGLGAWYWVIDTDIGNGKTQNPVPRTKKLIIKCTKDKF